MPLFKRLVERWVLEHDHLELAVFMNRLREIGANQRERGREQAMLIKDRQERQIDCFPFHEITMQKLSLSQSALSSQHYKRL